DLRTRWTPGSVVLDQYFAVEECDGPVLEGRDPAAVGGGLVRGRETELAGRPAGVPVRVGDLPLDDERPAIPVEDDHRVLELCDRPALDLGGGSGREARARVRAAELRPPVGDRCRQVHRLAVGPGDGGRTRRRCRGGRHGRGGAVAVVAGVLRGAGGEGGRDGTGDGECSDCSGEPGHGRGPFALLTPKRIVIILMPPRTHRRPTRWSAVTPPGRAARGYPVRDASVLLDGGLLGREIERDLAIVERRDEARLGGRLVRGGEAELAVRPAVGHVL